MVEKAHHHRSEPCRERRDWLTDVMARGEGAATRRTRAGPNPIPVQGLRPGRRSSQGTWTRRGLRWAGFWVYAFEMKRAGKSHSEPHSRLAGQAGAGKSEASSATGLTRHLDPLRSKLEELEREHKRLLGTIARKRARLEENEARAQRAGEALGSRLSAVRSRVVELSEGIRGLFAKFLSDSRQMSHRQRRQLEGFLAELEQELLLPSELDPEPDDSSEPRGRRRSHPSGFDAEEEVTDEGAVGGGGGYSAPKPDPQKQASLKTLFRKLALKLHPDHAMSDADRVERTEIFQEVTRAYESGDVARLLEIEQRWTAVAALESDAQLEARVAHLTQANGELRRQLRMLQKEDRDVRRSTPGEVSSDGAFAPNAEVDGLLRQYEEHSEVLERVHAFCVAYDAKQMPLSEFLRGPDLTFDREPIAESGRVEVFLDGLSDAERAEVERILVSELLGVPVGPVGAHRGGGPRPSGRRGARRG